MIRKNLQPEQASSEAAKDSNKTVSLLLEELYHSTYQVNFPLNDGPPDVAARVAALQVAIARDSSIQSDRVALANERVALRNEELQASIKKYTIWLVVLTIILAILTTIQVIPIFRGLIE